MKLTNDVQQRKQKVLNNRVRQNNSSQKQRKPRKFLHRGEPNQMGDERVFIPSLEIQKRRVTLAGSNIRVISLVSILLKRENHQKQVTPIL